MWATKLLSLVLILTALHSTCAQSKFSKLKPRICAGCVIPLKNPNDTGVINLIKKVINRQNQRLTFIKILSGTTQIIKGIKYNITFEAKSFDGTYECYTTFIDYRKIDVRYFKCERKN